MIIDYSTLRPPMAVLRAAGVTAAGRYIGWDSVPGYPSIGKNITKAEARQLHDAGIAVFLAFEYAADAALQGTAQGGNDGNLATHQLADLAAVPGMGVYFAVDFDAKDYAPALKDDGSVSTARAKLGPIAHYFDGIHALKPSYQVGGYGGYWVIKRLFDAKLITLGWQTVAWSSGNRDPRAVLYQLAKQVFGGADVNLHETAAADFGQWPRPSAPPAPKPLVVEHVTAGHMSLSSLASQHGETPAQLIRDTTAHASDDEQHAFSQYLNTVLNGSVPAATLMPAGLHLWVRQP